MMLGKINLTWQWYKNKQLITKSVNNFQGKRATEKTGSKNSTIKPPCTLSVSCMKIQGGKAPLPTPMLITTDCNVTFILYILKTKYFIKIVS